MDGHGRAFPIARAWERKHTLAWPRNRDKTNPCRSRLCPAMGSSGTRVRLLHLFDPGFRFEHGRLHAPLNLEATGLKDVAVGIGRDDHGVRDDAGGVTERTGNAEPVPAVG